MSKDSHHFFINVFSMFSASASRPEESPLKEAERSAGELSDLNIKSQNLIINGILETYDEADNISKALYDRQQNALKNCPETLSKMQIYYVPLRSYNMTGIENIRNCLNFDLCDLNDLYDYSQSNHKNHTNQKNHCSDKFKNLNDLINDLHASGKRVIFTMGKGGVGKTTIAAAIAKGLAAKGAQVHLSTTDPANHLAFVDTKDITSSRIDEKAVLAEYQKKVMDKARQAMGDADLSYIEEDLRSPCTQEIAVFNAFAEIVAKADNQIIVIDTAPTGHTLLLLDATLSYHHEVERTQGDITPSVKNLLPRLRNEKETEVVIVTQPEATPVFEAERLQADLYRAGIKNKWWVVNSSLLLTATTSQFLKTKAQSEIQWIEKVKELSQGNTAVIAWSDNNHVLRFRYPNEIYRKSVSTF